MEDDSVTVETVDDGVIEQSPLGPSSGSSPTSGESSYVDQILTVVSANGWFLILAIGILYILWKQYVEPRMQSNSGRYQSAAATNLSAEEILARQEAMELARRKMQEQYDKRAQEFAIKQKEKEEKLRQEKLKELEKYGPGLGCTNKTKAPKSSSEDSSSGAFKRKTEKSKLRPEYNPLMEGGSGTCFRPVRRGGAGGG